MTTLSERCLKTGGDPRALADYAALRNEMNKLTHPARPDINWPYAEKLCLALFENNGAELQTTGWYALIRTQLAGIYGLNEGLSLLVALLSREWGNLWPQPVHARMAILSGLSKRLQQAMRALTLTYADLSPLYQAEAHLKTLVDVLQRLELRHISQLDPLLTLVHNAAVRLENSANEGASALQTDADTPEEAGIPSSESSLEPTGHVKRVYITRSIPLPDGEAVKAFSPNVKPWRPFVAGMLTVLVLAGATIAGWRAMHQPAAEKMQPDAMLSSLPVALSAESLPSPPSESTAHEAAIKHTQQQLAQLMLLKPDWAISYGDHLAQQALALWPEQAKPLAQRWQQQLNAAALPVADLNGWHQGMTQLQQLANRLNALDEQKGKYMTVSELKSAVFAITQSFNRSVPAEEQLRQLSEPPANQPWSSAQQSQTEQHLQQLIVRYALLKHKASD